MTPWYAISVQIGAFMWLYGLKWVKIGSKRAQITRLGTPNGPGSFLEKCVFDPFLAHLWSQKRPVFRASWDSLGANWATTGSGRAKTTFLASHVA